MGEREGQQHMLRLCILCSIFGRQTMHSYMLHVCVTVCVFAADVSGGFQVDCLHLGAFTWLRQFAAEPNSLH